MYNISHLLPPRQIDLVQFVRFKTKLKRSSSFSFILDLPFYSTARSQFQYLVKDHYRFKYFNLSSLTSLFNNL